MMQGSPCALPIYFVHCTTTFRMFNPELADTSIRVRKDKSPDFGREKEVELKSSFILCSFPHSIQLLNVRSTLIAVHHLPLKISKSRLMQVQPMSTWDIRSGFSRYRHAVRQYCGFYLIVTGSLIPPVNELAYTSNPATSSACQQ